MAVIDPDGLFGGDRLRRCSNAAQLHWPRLFLASDGFGRLEINYARIVGKAYPTFNPIPPETEMQSLIREYTSNYLLFLYEVDGRLWGQWDTRSELLPRYKTARDRRSPIPPEAAFTQWRKSYREEHKAFPKYLGKVSEGFLHGVGVGVGVGDGKNICASNGDARVDLLPAIDNPPFSTTPSQEERWFDEWWAEYWLHKAKKPAKQAFKKYVRTQTLFDKVMAATRAQKPEMLSRDPSKRPHGATWLNGERWEDELPEQTTAEPSCYRAAEEDE